MFEILKAVLFGIIEGITEWLPISSTGHLILLEEIVSLKVSEAFYEMFQVVIQLGAILAVVLLFFHKLNPFSPKKNEKQRTMTWSLWFKVIVAVIPSAVMGLLLDDWLDEHLYNYFVVALTLVIYGGAEKQGPKTQDRQCIRHRYAHGAVHRLFPVSQPDPRYIPQRRHHPRRHLPGCQPQRSF